jgi:hypothetical protein
MRANVSCQAVLVCFFSYAPVFGCNAAEAVELDASAVVSGPEFDSQKGVWRYRVESQFMKGANAIEVLLPDDFDQEREYRVLYVLPVESGIGGRYGDGLIEVKKVETHNKYQVICVAVAFDTIPWYGAHATDRKIRHEDFIKRVAVPLVESRYRTSGKADGRLLLGFSKSGWGALTLILRSPDFFGYACSWDAPLMMDRSCLGMFGTNRHFGTPEQFAKYLPIRLIESNAEHFRGRARIAVLGHQSFGPAGSPDKRPHTRAFHEKLELLGVKHHYDNGLVVRHDWHSGWVRPAVDALMAIAGQQAADQ